MMSNKFQCLNELLQLNTRLLQLYENAVKILPSQKEKMIQDQEQIKTQLANLHDVNQRFNQSTAEESVATDSFIAMNDRNEVVYVKGQEDELYKAIEDTSKKIQALESRSRELGIPI